MLGAEEVLRCRTPVLNHCRKILVAKRPGGGKKNGMLDYVDCRMVSLYPRKVGMVLLAPEVDSVPSDV